MSKGKALFTDEGPQYYSAAFRHNAPFAVPGPYMTRLNPAQENDFRRWVSANGVRFNVNEPVSDYDMRGFYLATKSGQMQVGREPDGSIGYPDDFKTPYDTTFSAQSRYAKPDCPYHWSGDQLIDARNGQLVFDRTVGSAPGKQQGGQVGFDTGGTPNVPRYGTTTSDTPSIPGGPVSPDEWSQMPAGQKKLAIRTWATNAARAEGVDERHWVPYLERVASYETGQSGVSGTGNPNVVNMWDTNAEKNIPSIGLMQVIQPNAPGQNLLDPVVNMRAAIRYIRQSYGDVTNIPEAQGIQAGYETGGSPDPDLGVDENGLGRWQYPYKGSYEAGMSGDKIHQWEIAPTDAPADASGMFYDQERRVYYDPDRASVAEGQFNFDVTPNDPDAITSYHDVQQDSEGMLWRGVSDEEYQQAKARGYFESDKTYNIEGLDDSFQADKTFFSTDFEQAANYATGFAPWQRQPTFTRPAHVIGIPDRPDLPRGPLGNDPTSTEVGVPGQIPFDEVKVHWAANVIAINPGEMKNVEAYHGWETPSRSLSPRVTVQWEPGELPGPQIAPSSDIHMLNLAVEAAWQARDFDETKGAMRAAARDVQEHGYEGLNLTPQEIDDFEIGLPPKGVNLTETLGREIVSRATYSDPTEQMLYRGVIYDDAAMAELTRGQKIPLPLSSFTKDKAQARRFARGEAWRSADVPDNGKGVVFQLEPGAKVAEVSGEQVGFGRFEIVSNRKVGDLRFVTLRQVSLSEVDKDAIIRESLEGINERGGITIDLTQHQPTAGYGYAPSKTTEKMFEAGTITPEDIDAYIDAHFDELQGEGMHFGAWVSEKTKDVYLDVSKVGEANAETIRAAQQAEQLGIWDFGAPPELGEVVIGSIDDETKVYTPLGTPEEMHSTHQAQVEEYLRQTREKLTAPPDVEPPTPEKILGVEPPSTPLEKPVIAPKLPKVGKDGPGRGGPGAARAAEKPTPAEVLGKAGKVFGPALTLANDAFQAYGLVDMAAQQGLQEQVAKGNVVAQGPDFLGIPTGTAFADPTFKNQQSTAGRSQADIQHWLKTGQWPQQQTTLGPGNGGASFDPQALEGKQRGGQARELKLHSSFRIQHADGTITRHQMRQIGPKNYTAHGITIKPGDRIMIDGHHA